MATCSRRRPTKPIGSFREGHQSGRGLDGRPMLLAHHGAKYRRRSRPRCCDRRIAAVLAPPSWRRVAKICRAEDFYAADRTLFAGQPGGVIYSEMRSVSRFLGKFIGGRTELLLRGTCMAPAASPCTILQRRQAGRLTPGHAGRSRIRARTPVISGQPTPAMICGNSWIGSSASSIRGSVCAAPPCPQLRDLRNAKPPSSSRARHTTRRIRSCPRFEASYENSAQVVRGYPGINDAGSRCERASRWRVSGQSASIRLT